MPKTNENSTKSHFLESSRRKVLILHQCRFLERFNLHAESLFASVCSTAQAFSFCRVTLTCFHLLKLFWVKNLPSTWKILGEHVNISECLQVVTSGRCEHVSCCCAESQTLSLGESRPHRPCSRMAHRLVCFHLCFFTGQQKYVAVQLPVHIPTCVSAALQRRCIIHLTHLLSVEPGVKLSRAARRQWVTSEYLGCFTVPPPALSPQTAAGLRGICQRYTPKTLPLRVCVGVKLHLLKTRTEYCSCTHNKVTAKCVRTRNPNTAMFTQQQIHLCWLSLISGIMHFSKSVETPG